VRAGLYTAQTATGDEYSVGKLSLSGEWFADGPGADCVMPTKRAAQQVCADAAVGWW